MSTLEEITAAAVQLPPDERAVLVEALQETLEVEALTPEFLAECDRRFRELEEGTVRSLSIEESRARMQQKFPWLK